MGYHVGVIIRRESCIFLFFFFLGGGFVNPHILKTYVLPVVYRPSWRISGGRCSRVLGFRVYGSQGLGGSGCHQNPKKPQALRMR